MALSPLLGRSRHGRTFGFVVWVATLALVLAVLAADRGTAEAGHQPPATMFGTGLIDGDVVEAFIGASSCGSTIVAGGTWVLVIPHDAPCAPVAGDTITFRLNGLLTSAIETWEVNGLPTDTFNGVTFAGTRVVLASCSFVTLVTPSGDAAFTNQFLYVAGTLGVDDFLLGVTNKSAIGTSVVLGQFPAGELIVGIAGPEGVFYSGPASRNLDNIAHAIVIATLAGFDVGFEDLSGGGDLDYNDATFSLAVVPCGTAPVTLTVNTDDDLDDGACDIAHCSLREAINAANNNAPFTDTIAFDIAGGGAHSISPASALPLITDPVVIDGYTQPGSSPNTNGPALGSNAVLMIELNGFSAGGGVHGLEITAGSSTVRGLAINRFDGDGLFAWSGGGNVFEGNFLGTDVTGSVDLGNGEDGIDLRSPNHTIGGTTAAARNVISGNGVRGVVMQGAASGNVVTGNLIGTDASGTADLGNGQDGVTLLGVPGNVVGGTIAAARNVISGNGLSGVRIKSAGATGNVVLGNFIGTDVTGTLDLGNSFRGVVIEDAPANTIGGTTADSRNVLSGNGWQGVDIVGNAATGNQVSGNYIGTDVSGAVALGNASSGVRISGAPGNTIGGTTPGERNVISGNAGDGVLVLDTGATGNVVSGNYIGTDVSGTTALGNAFWGVEVSDASGNSVADNVISGNGFIQIGDPDLFFGGGVHITAAGATGNTVRGNMIGLNSDGNSALGNTRGVAIDAGASSNTVGGSTVADRNVISGNVLRGVLLGGGDSGSGGTNAVLGNFIGTDGGGTVALGNVKAGVLIFGSSHNTVAANVIAGNGQFGVVIVYRPALNLDASNNTIEANWIGTNAAGDILGNAVDGVAIGNADADSDAPSASGNTVEANTIAFNGGAGVRLRGGVGTGIGNSILTNSIHSNFALGIDLGSVDGVAVGDGVTANDAGDTDSGANNLQNFPEIDAVTLGSVTIEGTLDTLAAGTYRLEFFANTVADPLGFGEGERFLGSFDFVHGGSGAEPFTAVLGATAVLGEFITATATSPSGDTSEFSAAFLAVDITPPNDPADVSSSSHTVGAPSNDVTIDMTWTAATDLGGSGVDGYAYVFNNTSTPTCDEAKDLEETVTGVTSLSLADGDWWFHICTVDNAGNWTSTVTAGAFVVDTTPPDPPSTPDLADASDSGASNSDGITKINEPTFEGTAEEDSTVELFEGPTSLGSTTATGGAWTITSSVLADGEHVITATATDAAGNTSLLSAGLTVTIDTAAPATPSTPDLTDASDSGRLNDDDITKIGQPTFDGPAGAAEDNSEVELFANAASVGKILAGPAGDWTITSSSLMDGDYAMTTTATDVAGNTSAASAPLDVTIDTIAPPLPSLPNLAAEDDTGSLGDDDVTKQIADLTVSGTAEADSDVALSDGETPLGNVIAAGGSWDFELALAEGAHSLTAKATDVAGNTSDASAALDLLIDTTKPNTTIAFPVAGVRYGESEWNDGCGTAGVGDVCGGAADPVSPEVVGVTSGLEEVEFSLQQLATDLYWDGAAFTAPAETFIAATGTVDWTQLFAFANFPEAGPSPFAFLDDLEAGNYTLHARATDIAGNVEASPTATFTINTPPIAKFEFAPADIGAATCGSIGSEFADCLAPRYEGSFIQLIDTSFDIDSTNNAPDEPNNDDIVSWQWVITGPGLAVPLETGAQNPSFMPPDDGLFTVSLTVTDSFGVETTVFSGDDAGDTTEVPELTVRNAPPLVNALNIEVLADASELFLIGRFVDGGYLDTHTAGWGLTSPCVTGIGLCSPDGSIVLSGGDVTLLEDHTPALGTGLVTATLDGSGLLPPLTVAEFLGVAGPLDDPDVGVVGVVGVLRVVDDSGDPLSDSFDDAFLIAVVEDDPGSREPNNSIADSRVLASDGVYLSYIQSGGDIDIFEVKWPGAPAVDGGEVPASPGDPVELPLGAEVLVTLRDLPADYDLILLTQRPGVDIAPFSLSPFSLSPYSLSPFSLSPFSLSPFSLSPFSLSPFSLSPFSLSPFSLSPFSLSPFSLSPFSLSPYSLSPYSESPFSLSPFSLSPFSLSPYSLSPFSLSPFSLSPFSLSPFSLSPFSLSPFSLSPFSLSPFSLSPFSLSPMSQLAFTGLEGDEISGTDIDFAELGLTDIVVGNVAAAGFSANLGLEDETVLVRIDAPGTRVFAVVVGANNAHSLAPYSLQIEASMPFDQALVLSDNPDDGSPNNLDAFFAGTEICGSAPFTTPGTPTVNLLNPGGSHVSAPETLFITNRARLAAPGDPMWATLTALANRADIKGKIISIETPAYDDWDSNPCSIDAANRVTDVIHDVVVAQTELPGSAIKYVVILGSDDVVPQRRVQDETVISSERYYLLDSALEPGSPLFASVSQGYNLTDDFYGDLVATSWQGRELYIPDLQLGRLVETPEEIAAAAQAFIDSEGQLAPQTALATGYDFFEDGATKIAETIDRDAGFPELTDRLIGSNWTAADLLCEFLGQGAGCGDNVSDINAVNAHFTHYGALSACGFDPDCGLGSDDYITSTTIADAEDLATVPTGTTALAQRLVFTIGCHAGFNVPAGSGANFDPGLGIDPELDFVQAMAIQRAIYVASTGFGLGDSVGLGGTEQLMVFFTEELMEGGATAGAALRRAKLRFLSGLKPMTVYDEKSSIQVTLFGLPQYKVLDGTPSASTVLPTSPLAVTTVANGTPDGTYYTIDGDSQGTPGRAIQPRTVFFDIPEAAAGPVHSILVTGGTFTDIDTFNPVITRPTIEWEADPQEPQVCLSSFWPSSLATVNSLDLGDGKFLQTLVFIPGQFKCTSDDGATVTGIQRLYSSVQFELIHGDPLFAGDFEPPIVSSLDLESVSSIDVTVTASDPSGIARIVILLVASDGSITVAADTTIPAADANAGVYTITIDDPAPDETIAVQVIDGAGNLTTITGKGASISVIAVDASVTPSVIPTRFHGTVTGFTDAADPVLYSWDFGDGTFLSGTLEAGNPDFIEFSVDGSGTLNFTVDHRYSAGGQLEADVSNPIIATMKINDSDGGTGTKTVSLVPCGDAIGDAGGTDRPDGDLIACSVENDGSTMTVTLRANDAIDPDGKQQTRDFRYRVRLDVGTTSIDPVTGEQTLVFGPPDGQVDGQLQFIRGKATGLPSVVAVVTGDSVAFTFDLADIGRSGAGAVDAPILWQAETQAGLKGPEGSCVGINDNLPNSGLFGYALSGGTPFAVSAQFAADDSNRAPCARADSYGTDAGVTLAVSSAEGVLANDFDSDGDPLNATLLAGSGPDNGVLTLSADGAFTYVPAAGFTGSDTFRYIVDDGKGGTSIATVTIDVHEVAVSNNPPEAVDDGSGGPIPISGKSLEIDVLENDTDPDLDPLAVVDVTHGENGNVQITSDGSAVTYKPRGKFTGPDSFTYTISDGEGGTSTATVFVDVQ